MKKVILFLLTIILIPLIVNCTGRIEGYVSKSDERAAVEDVDVLDAVEVTLSPQDGSTAPPAERTNQSGYYVFEGLTPGYYDMTFTALNHGNVTSTFDNVEVEENLTTPVSIKMEILTSSSTVVSGTFSVEKSTIPITCDVSFEVFNDGDCPIYGIVVKVILYTDSAKNTAITTAYGSVEDTTIQPGSSSEGTIDDIDCGAQEPKAITCSIDSLSCPSAWSIHSQ